MVDNFNHLRIEDKGHYIICHLSNPPTHTLTSSGVAEIHKFLDGVEKKNDLRVLMIPQVEGFFVRFLGVLKTP